MSFTYTPPPLPPNRHGGGRPPGPPPAPPKVHPYQVMAHAKVNGKMAVWNPGMTSIQHESQIEILLHEATKLAEEEDKTFKGPVLVSITRMPIPLTFTLDGPKESA